MIKQDTIARIHPIGLPVVDGDPETVKLGDTIRRTRIERGGFGLGSLYDFSVQFGRGGLIKADVFLEPTRTNGVEQTKGAETINVTGVFSHLKRDLNVRLSTEIINLSWLNLSNNVDEIGAVAQITVMKLKLVGSWLSPGSVRSGRSDRISKGTYSHVDRHTGVVTCLC